MIFHREERILRRQQWRERERLPVSDELDVLKSVTAQLEGASISDCGGMKDTSPEMDARYQDMLMQRSGEERLMMGCAMRETARTLAEASIREQDPQATPETVRKGIFLRFYGHEFDADSRTKILAAIESVTHPVAK